MRGQRSGAFTTRRIEETPGVAQRARHHLVGRDHEILDQVRGAVGCARGDVAAPCRRRSPAAPPDGRKSSAPSRWRASRSACAASSCSLSCAASSADAATFAGGAALPSSHAPTPIVCELRAVAHAAPGRSALEAMRHPRATSIRSPRPRGPGLPPARSGPSRAAPAAWETCARRCRPWWLPAPRGDRSALPLATAESTSATAHQHADAAGRALGPLDLVEVARIVVIDRGPQQGRQIAKPAARARRGCRQAAARPPAESPARSRGRASPGARPPRG